ncbi:MAG: PAS domain S-box protein [Gammaproteobacteria bacterium]
MKTSADASASSAVELYAERNDHDSAEPATPEHAVASRWQVWEHAPIGIHWVDRDGIITWANQAELKMLGYRPEEYIGRHIAEFHADAEVIADILRRLQNGETLCNYEARLRCRDGSIRHGAIDSNVVWKDGKFIHTRCFTRDVTARKQLEESGHRQLGELNTIYQTAPIGLALVDAEFRFARINERLAEINGLSVEQHLGRSIREVVPALADQAEAVFREVFATGKPLLNVEFEGETPAQPGVRRTWVESWHPLKDARGETIAINVLVEEVTERKRAEAALAKSARQKEALYQLVDRLHRTKSLDEIYDAALQAIVAALPCDRASILLFDELGVMRFVGWRRLSDGYRRAVEGHSPWQRDAVDPQPICIEDVERADIPPALKATVVGEGIGALAFIPLVADNKLIGKFMAYFDAPHQFPADEIELSLSIARQLAFAIERQRTDAALRESERRFREMIDALPAAIYTTDAAGRITHYNPAAVEFAGQAPKIGTDRWCVSWKLYTADGAPLPHDECPMAMALKHGRAIRGVEAIAERPDGARRWFTPYPTPLHDANGAVVGGINMLVDITERKAAEQAQARLATIVSSSTDAILSKTPDGIVTSWNTSAERMFGYTAEEILGQPIYRLIPLELRAEEEGLLARLRAGERIEHYETTRIAKDGRRLDVALTLSAIKSPAGAITGASSIMRDITERKRADELAHRHARQLQLITDNAPVHIAYCDTQRRFKFVNKSYAARFGLSPQDIVGKTIAEVIGEPAYAAIRNYVHVVLHGEPVEFDVEIPYATGARFMHCSYAPETDADGAVVGWVSAIVDITERRNIERALRASEEKLKEADHRKDEFLAMLAHELRNPLAPILTAVHLLRTESASNTARDHVRDIIERQTRRLARLVDDLLDVSRITSGRIRLQMEPVAVADVIQRAVETIRPLMEQFGHTFNVTGVPESVWLNCDSARIEQVLVNLLNNAAKYTDCGGRIDLSMQFDGYQVALYVRDTGIGIEPKLLPHIFELFTQAERTVDRSHGGLGIGLSLVHRLVAMHGGTIDVKSEVGRGSEFCVRLPAIPAPARSSAGVDGEVGQSTFAPLRVLVVDDNVDAAQSLAILLETAGHAVATAYDGQAALAAADKHRPQVVFLDLGLPTLDGCEVAKRLRAMPAGANATLVAITGYGQEADRRRTREAGFDQHLVKPVDFDAVQEILQKVGESRSG